MFDGPFDRQVQRAPGQVADDDIQRPDVDLRFVFAVERVKVRRRMFPPEHLDDDPEELADGGHGSAA